MKTMRSTQPFVASGRWLWCSQWQALPRTHGARLRSRTSGGEATILAGFMGAASALPGTDVAAGATVGWEVAPHFTVEGRGVWLDAGDRANAFAALLGARVPLLPARRVVPVLSGGVGVYRATFSASTRIPAFYQRRMTSDASGFRGRAFHDFVAALGGGVDVSLARHLALRPEVTVLLVTSRSDTHVVPVYGYRSRTTSRIVRLHQSAARKVHGSNDDAAAPSLRRASRGRAFRLCSARRCRAAASRGCAAGRLRRTGGRMEPRAPAARGGADVLSLHVSRCGASVTARVRAR